MSATAITLLEYSHNALESGPLNVIERFMVARSISDVKRFLMGEITEDRLKALHPDLTTLTATKERV